MTELLKLGISQGLGYGLFIFLLFYVLKANDERELRYQTLINSTIEKLKIIESIQIDVKEIRNKVWEVKK